MWIVSRKDFGVEASREPVNADIRTTLVRWYAGDGTEADEAVGVALVKAIKQREQWIACDCLGARVHPPLLAPAYLSMASTFYLRRLTGQNRPEHDKACPFFQQQKLREKPPTSPEPKPVKPVDDFFAALKPLGNHLAQKPDPDAPSSHGQTDSVPRLARLLWSLMEAAQTNVVEAIGQRPKPSIAIEHERLRNAAQKLLIAPEIPLARHLHHHPADFHARRIYARLRAATPSWPRNHEPQAYLCCFAKDVSGKRIIFADGEPIEVASPIAKPAGKMVDRSPYLVLVAIGDHDSGYAPIRAYAQPIVDGRRFLPVDSNNERILTNQLLALQWTLHERGIATRIKKPVFDIDTPQGPCRPDFMVDVLDRPKGRRQLVFIEMMGFDTAEYAARKAITHPRMLSRAPVVEVSAEELRDPPSLSVKLDRALTSFGRHGERVPHSRESRAPL